ncbi:MAG: gene transfer agent family protein [Sphingomonas sp.]|nr:gene transfer agent family protein [Sphingomonas sp.]
MTKAKLTVDDAVRPESEERGEVAITLDGERMVLRPSYEAIEAFEAGTGKALIVLAQLAATRSLSLVECSIVACECIRAWGRATNNRGMAGANSRRIAELILDSDGGVMEAMSSLTAVLALAATGKYTASGELKPVTTKTTDEAPVAG